MYIKSEEGCMGWHVEGGVWFVHARVGLRMLLHDT